MPRPISEYSLRDHLRLRPILHALKTRRYKRMDARYFALSPAVGDLAEIRSALAGRRVLVTVAFEDPEILDVQLRLIRRFVDHDAVLVADNSRVGEKAAEIRSVSAQHHAPYLRLPENPWTARNDSRSHGIALNWVWRNVLKPAHPLAFGLLDHDLIPVEPQDPFEPLGRLPFYGDLRTGGRRWFLWAGFCFFRFDAVKDRPLDFGLDWFVGLDTGGGNWEVLYRDFDRTRLPDRPVHEFAALPGRGEPAAVFEHRCGWLHEVGWRGAPDIRIAKRKAFLQLLAPHLYDDSGRHSLPGGGTSADPETT